MGQDGYLVMPLDAVSLREGLEGRRISRIYFQGFGAYFYRGALANIERRSA